MKPSTAEPEPEIIHPPLARDALGNLLPLPAGTAAWRISHHTAGRPRVLTGPDGSAMRFPLSITAAELVELCGPDTYRVYALDELGEVLDFVRTLQAARPRNANLPDVPLAALQNAPDAAPTTDLRFALHALTEIARINGEALRAISDSQADWIKTLAMNKGRRATWRSRRCCRRRARIATTRTTTIVAHRAKRRLSKIRTRAR